MIVLGRSKKGRETREGRTELSLRQHRVNSAASGCCSALLCSPVKFYTRVLRLLLAGHCSHPSSSSLLDSSRSALPPPLCSSLHGFGFPTLLARVCSASPMFGDMAADSSMGMSFRPSSSLYHHHDDRTVSFQANPDYPSPAPAPPPPVFLPPPPPNAPVLHGPPPNYRFVTGSPADWTAYEVAILKEGLVRYSREPNMTKYIKIAAILPTRTIRDVVLRCCWTAGKDSRRRKPDEFYAGKRIRDSKEKMVASTSLPNFQMAPPNNLFPFSMSMHHSGQNNLVTHEDNATQHLLEENIQLLSQISSNIETFKLEENMDLFLRTNSNIRTISKRMSETPGIMGQMRPLPEPVNEDHLSSLLQLGRAVASSGDIPHNCHMKEDGRS